MKKILHLENIQLNVLIDDQKYGNNYRKFLTSFRAIVSCFCKSVAKVVAIVYKFWWEFKMNEFWELKLLLLKNLDQKMHSKEQRV